MSIYLDNAATNKPKQEVVEAMMPYLTEQYYNPSSLYSPAVKVKEDIERARKVVGSFIKASGNEIYFTSSGSASNCWVVQGFLNRCRRRNKEAVIITSVIEHKSIMECVEHMCVGTYYVPVDAYGFINMEMLEAFLHDAYNEAKEILVSIQLCNNEIGVIQDCKAIANLVHKYDGIFHTDAVQCVGQIPIDVKELGVDLLSASAHKFGGIKGSGFLYKRKGIEIDPLIYGSQMDGMYGGTENVPYIIGMAKAIELCDVSEEKIKDMCSKRDYFIGCLEYKFGCKLNGGSYPRLPNNINVTFPQNISGESLLYLLDMSDVYISTGSACNSMSIEPSYVLKAIGLTNDKAMRTLRFTIGSDITYNDINKVIEEIYNAIRLIEE